MVLLLEYKFNYDITSETTPEEKRKSGYIKLKILMGYTETVIKPFIKGI